ncbi:cytochrome c oxidase subunit 2A [Bacillus sp. EB600]|nr:cytochrome c oxidase subunit 2A [Bacillus sp. EB600]MCQ6277854.1 cytochrome c oxidase subunit 2A [Bacillus sp. EB600]
MANTELNSNTKTEIEDKSSLKGTMVSVSFLGLFIVVTWVSVYFLFLSRL